nr:uncharacterized protein LOC113809337 [Penaeus vannamei]
MPVLRAKSPRVEGGRCYPKVCWSAVTRATHWGISTRSSAPETHSAKSARSAKSSQIFNGFPVDSDQGGVTSRPDGDSEANGCRREMGAPRAPAAPARHQGGVHAAQPLPASALPRGAQQHRQARLQPSTPRSATPSRSSASASTGKGLSNGGAFRAPGTRLRFFSRSVAAPPPPACDDHHCDVDDLCDASSASDCSSASDAHSSSGGHSLRDSCSGSDDDGACSGTCCIPAGDAPCCLLPCAHTSAGAKIIRSAISVPSTRHCGYGAYGNENDASIAKMPLRARSGEGVTTAACMGALSCRLNGARDGGAGRAATPNGHCETQVLDRCDEEAPAPRHPRAESEPSVSRDKDASDRNTAPRGIVCRIGRQQDSSAAPMVRQDTFTIERGQGGISPRGEGGLSLPMLSRPLCPSPTPTPSLATLRPRAGQSGTSNGSKLRPPATHYREAARLSPARSNGAASAPYSRGSLSQPRAALAASRGGRRRSASENGDLGAEERLGGGADTPPWEPHHVAKGPRGSGNTKRGAPYSRSSVSSDEHDQQAASGQQKEDPPPHQPTHRGRRAMKITLREEATKKNTNLTTPASRTRSGSRSSGGSSPATIHGRAPHKTATAALIGSPWGGRGNYQSKNFTFKLRRRKAEADREKVIGYGYQGTAGRNGEGASSNNSNNSSTNVTKIPGSSGLVRNRVAMLEKTPTKTTPQPPVRRSSLKKPVIRPTSLEKTPILVMPVTEKTVELSKPVCRRLEYSECKNVKSDAQNEISGEIQQGINPKLSTSHPKAEDILIVGSIEVETHTDNNILLEAENHGSYYENSYEKTPLIVKEVPLKHSPENNKANENKAANDVIEKEKLHVVTYDGDSSEYLSETTNDYTDSSLSERVDDSCDTGEMVNGHYLQSPDEFGMKILTPQSESSFEILESLSETVELSTEEARDDYSLTEPEISESKATILEVKRQESAEGLAPSNSGSEGRTSTEELSKPPLKPKPKLPSVSPEKLTNPSEVSKPSCIPTDAHIAKSESSQKSPVGSPVDKKKPVGMGMTLVKATDMKSSVDSSIDSPKSTTGNPMVESSDRSTLSGKCTPTLNSGRGDLDQDFLIDDEIADQPGLMFGGSTMASSFFTDDGIFDDLTATSPSHVPLKSAAVGSGRSRANSVDTASSLGADDLMLDFDIEEGKAGGSSNRSSNSSSLSVGLPGSLTGARPKKMHLRITIPGRRYDEEVLSPDASEIFSEWTAMMAEVGSSVAERCVSRDGSSGGGRTSRPRLNSSSDVSSPDPRRPTVLRPPRQGGLSEGEGGGVCIDRTSYHYMCQDVTALKTMLLRLRRVLQAADTINPFDANLRNSLYLSLASSDSPGGCGINGDKDSLTPSVIELSQENIDLRRQVVLLQQQLEERDRTIRLLQQQLAQSLVSQKTTCNPTDAEAPTNTVNAATQTERSSRPTLTGSSLSRAASIDDGLGPTVSFRLGKQVHVF